MNPASSGELHSAFISSWWRGSGARRSVPREFLGILSKVTKRLLILQTHFAEAKDPPSLIQPRRLRQARALDAGVSIEAEVGFDVVLEQFDGLGERPAHEMTEGSYRSFGRSTFVGAKTSFNQVESPIPVGLGLDQPNRKLLCQRPGASIMDR